MSSSDQVFILASVFLYREDEVVVDLCGDNIWPLPAKSGVNNVLTPRRAVSLKSICAYLCCEPTEKKPFGDKLEWHLSRLRQHHEVR